MLSSKRVIPLPRTLLFWPDVFTPDGESPRILKIQEKKYSSFIVLEIPQLTQPTAGLFTKP